MRDPEDGLQGLEEASALPPSYPQAGHNIRSITRRRQPEQFAPQVRNCRVDTKPSEIDNGSSDLADAL